MKNLKKGLLALAAVIGTSSTLFMASCEKDSCTTLKCKNGGTCADNFCRCPTGYEGAECEIKTAQKFIGKWPGLVRCNAAGAKDSLGPTFSDTLTIFMAQEPNRLGLTRYRAYGDTTYGTASGGEIVFAPQFTDSFRRQQSLVLNDKNIDFLIITTRDTTNPATQSNCRFVGYTANKQ